MASPSLLFDRENFVNTLKTECLGDRGRSAVILGGLKVGKSHLLEHLCERASLDVTNLYCRLDVDILKAVRNPSDDTFLREFLGKLAEQLIAWKKTEKPKADAWYSALREAQGKLDNLSNAPPDDHLAKYRSDHEKVVQDLQEKMNVWNSLSKALDDVVNLKQLPPPLEVSELAPVLTDLRDLGKRIILVVDDYDRMVTELPFTDNLFAFLRGASSERKIIVLVASRKRLMDCVSDKDPTDRKSLFNHFQLQRLRPFKRTEPEEFLVWLGRPKSEGGDGQPLQEQEKKYICSVAGGCPHFLRYARTQFLSQRLRSFTPAERRSFERDFLTDEFHNVFEQVWRSATEEEKAIMRSIADGALVDPGSADRLEVEGYLVENDGGKLTVSSSLLAEFIKQKPRPAGTAPVFPTIKLSAPIQVTATFCEVFPSALGLACPDKAEFALFRIDNAGASSQLVQVSCELPRYSSAAKWLGKVEPGDNGIPLSLSLTDSAKNLRTPSWLTGASYSITLNPGPTQELLEIKPIKKIKLLPRDHFLFARFDPNAQALVDFTWLIAAWVNRDEPALQSIRELAVKQEDRLGYPAAGRPDQAAHLRAQVSALYQAAKTKEIKYHNAPIVFHSAENDYMQRVKTCDQTLDTKAANCLDGAVLLASLMSLCNIDPVILFIPGHALAGWKNPQGVLPEWQFFDTTALSTSAFDGAYSLGQNKYREAEIKSGTPALNTTGFIADASNFAIVVDIHRNIQERGIVSI